MEIIESHYELKLSHNELAALGKALDELEILMQKLPDERNGYDLNSQSCVEMLRSKINNVL